ncbi:unnamed protein product [Phaeothamnion confervicola]
MPPPGWLRTPIWALLGACSASAVIIVKLLRKIKSLERSSSLLQEQRDSQHRGMKTAEKARKALQSFVANLGANDGHIMRPIGTIESCFKECVGTPRQGALAPSTVALLHFKRSCISPEALDSLEQFSHCWIYFVFHLNTNARSVRAHDTPKDTFRAKIEPPFLKRRVGVFATRSPHRPSALGASLCRLERVDKKAVVLHLAGVDVVRLSVFFELMRREETGGMQVDGTPILDVKPYSPAYDFVAEGPSARPRGDGAAEGRCHLCGIDRNFCRDGGGGGGSGGDNDTDGAGGASCSSCKGGGCLDFAGEGKAVEVRVADWVAESVRQRRLVEWDVAAERQLADFLPTMRLFASYERAFAAITETLQVDLRSLRLTRKAVAAPSTLKFDTLLIEFVADTGDFDAAVRVTSVQGSKQNS